MKLLFISLLVSSICFAKPETQPEVSIVQGSEKGISVLVLTWPKGETDLLIYKDRDLEPNKKSLFKWVEERTNDYNRKH